MGLNYAQKEFEIDRLLQDRDFSKAISLLETWISDTEEYSEIAELARALAEAHAAKDPKSKKAFQYAKMAAENFIQSSRAAPALGLLAWMRQFSQAFSEYESLERLIVMSFSRSSVRKRAKPDDDRPPPTPFQKILAQPSVYSFGDDSLSRFQLQEIPNRLFPLLSNLKASEVARLLRVTEFKTFKDGDQIFKEGDQPLGFYIVARGQVQLESSSGLIKVAREEEFIGDIALFGGMNHSSKAIAHGRCEILFFPEISLRECFDQIPRLKEEILDHFYRRVFKNTAAQSIIFGILKPEELERAWDYFVPIRVPAGRVLMEPNRESDRLFLILKGKVEVLKYGEPAIHLGPGHFVGERGLILKTMRTATLTAVSDCQLLECDRWSFEELCEDFSQIPRVLAAKRKELEEFVFNSRNLVVD